MGESVLLSIRVWAVWWGVVFTAQTYCLFALVKPGGGSGVKLHRDCVNLRRSCAIFNETILYCFSLLNYNVLNKEHVICCNNTFSSAILKLSWSLIAHNFRAVKRSNTRQTMNLTVFASRFLWQGKNTTSCAGCKTYLNTREVCHHFLHSYLLICYQLHTLCQQLFSSYVKKSTINAVWRHWRRPRPFGVFDMSKHEEHRCSLITKPHV